MSDSIAYDEEALEDAWMDIFGDLSFKVIRAAREVAYRHMPNAYAMQDDSDTRLRTAVADLDRHLTKMAPNPKPTPEQR